MASLQEEQDRIELAKQTHLETLRERLDRASARGDDAAVRRYGQLIEARQAELVEEPE